MAYQIPPWLARDTDPAGKYMQGLHLGAQIGQAQNQMAQQAQEMAMKTQIALQENERDFQFRQQQAQINHAVAQQEMDMKRQQLEMAKQQNDMKTQMAARKFAAQQRVSQAIAAGTKPEEAILQNYSDLFQTPAGISGFVNAMKSRADIPIGLQVLKYGGKEYPFAVNPRTGHFSRLDRAEVGSGKMTDQQKQRLAQLNKTKAYLQKEWSGDPRTVAFLQKQDPEGFKKAQAKLADIDKEINQIVPPQGMGQSNNQPSPPVAGRYSRKGGLEMFQPTAPEEPSEGLEPVDDEEY